MAWSRNIGLGLVIYYLIHLIKGKPDSGMGGIKNIFSVKYWIPQVRVLLNWIGKAH